MLRRMFAAVGFAFLLQICSAGAQIPLQFPIEPPAPFLREALDHPYGRALIGEFAKSVAQSADAACLQSKRLDQPRLTERGRDLFQRYGTKSMEILIANVDVRLYEAKIIERAGPGSVGELMRLREDPEVKKYLDLERPFRIAKILDFVIENFDRYVLLNRIRLQSFAPVSTGNDGLLRASPVEAAEEAMEKFVADNKSQQFSRFYRLSEFAADALLEAFNRELALRWGPGTFYCGVENDLAELCITRR